VLKRDLVAEYLDFYHFNIGAYFRSLIENDNPIMTPKLREQMENGILLDPRNFLKIIEKDITELAKSVPGIVFSGQPRTVLETFGDDSTNGFIDFLEDIFSKENIFIFRLDIPSEVTIERNLKRGRKDDIEEVIKVRLKEYKERTEPIYKLLEERGFNIINIDGATSREEVFEEVKRHIS